MSRRSIRSGFVGVALLMTACGQDSAVGPRAPVEPGVAASAGTPISPLPDPGDATAFRSAVGEKVIVCNRGYTTSGFDVASAGGTTRVEVRPGDCVLAYRADGETQQVTVTQRVPNGQQLDRVDVTQLTCGLGRGIQCGGGGPNIVQTSLPGGPVTGYVGGTGPAANRSQQGLSGYVAEFYTSFVPGEVALKGEHIIVCVKGLSRATALISVGSSRIEVPVTTGCQSVYGADGETKTATVALAVGRAHTVAQAYVTQLTCNRGRGRQCDPSNYPVVVGPTLSTIPVTGYVGGTGSSASPSELGQSGFTVQFFVVPAI